jgi:hypothetical protein
MPTKKSLHTLLPFNHHLLPELFASTYYLLALFSFIAIIMVSTYTASTSIASTSIPTVKPRYKNPVDKST